MDERTSLSLHVESPTLSRGGIHACGECEEDWPCSVARLRAERDALRAALEWYADRTHYRRTWLLGDRVSPILWDGGLRAGDALAAKEE